MAIDVLITPASGSIYISGSEAQTPTPPNLTNGSNYLWASGTTLQWGSQEVYTNTPAVLKLQEAVLQIKLHTIPLLQLLQVVRI